MSDVTDDTVKASTPADLTGLHEAIGTEIPRTDSGVYLNIPRSDPPQRGGIPAGEQGPSGARPLDSGRSGKTNYPDIPVSYQDPIPTLRDQFAMAALSGAMHNCDWTGANKFSPIATFAYQIADAMMEARKK